MVTADSPGRRRPHLRGWDPYAHTWAGSRPDPTGEVYIACGVFSFGFPLGSGCLAATPWELLGAVSPKFWGRFLGKPLRRAGVPGSYVGFAFSGGTASAQEEPFHEYGANALAGRRRNSGQDR